MKPIGNHGDLGMPEPGGQGKGAPGGRDELIIVHADDDFDIDAVFRSEEPTAEKAEPPAAGAPETPAPAPAAVAEQPQTFLPPVVEPRVTAAAPMLPIETAATLPVVRADAAPAPRVVPAAADRAEPAAAADIPRDRRSAALLIADLVENHVRLEWHEAVAIAQHLCQIMAREPGANVHRSLVEPWNIEITDSGELQVLPGGSSSDPIVKQVGRVLRVLLQDTIAPAELRLVASQASFEVPVYSSLDELSAALQHFVKADHADAIRAAFNRGLEAKLSGLPAPDRPVLPPPAVIPKIAEAKPVAKRPVAAKTTQPARQALERKPSRPSSSFLMRAGAAVLVAGTAVFLTARYAGQSGLLSQVFSPAPQPAQPPAPQQAQPSPAIRGPEAVAPGEAARALTPPAAVEPDAVPSVSPPPVPPPAVPPRAVREARVAPAPRPRAAGAGTTVRDADVAPPTPAPRGPDSAARSIASAGDSVEALLRRAGALLAEGRDGEAVVILDGVVTKNPLYQPDPARFTPETLSAFQNSKRLLLPAMARRYYQEARVAYDAGDFTMALTKSERAQALLRDADIDPADATLDDDVTGLIAMVNAARTLEEAKIYTSADRDVTPPRPIGRQLSTASVSGRAPLTGRLEIVVGRQGEVETVRLETPVNGYHDRMIVSAAKAWHYRPALRKGRPVRYSMVMSITLPDF